MKEEWRDIPGYDGYYQVSNQGGVKSLDRYIVCENGKQCYYKGKILKCIKDKQRYVLAQLYKNSRLKRYLISRLVLTVFDRNPKDNEECNHKDGNKSNNHIENIEWVTSKENCRHKIDILKKDQRGEKNPTSKLNETQVYKIRILLKQEGMSQRSIAKKFGVSYQVITNIKLNRSWRHTKV